MDIQREMALREIMAASFSALDLHLYLNTHPNDKQALMMFNNYSRRTKILTENFESMYGPLTVSASNNYPWQWIQSPWPWEC